MMVEIFGGGGGAGGAATWLDSIMLDCPTWLQEISGAETFSSLTISFDVITEAWSCTHKGIGNAIKYLLERL